MEKVELVKIFFSLVEKKEWSKVEEILSDKFYFWGPFQRPLNKEEWLAAQKALHEAFPDWAFNVRQITKEGNCIHASVHVSGTHVNPLQLPIPGSIKVLPTGAKIELPVEKAIITFDEDQILEISLEIGFLDGLDQFLKALGMK